MIFGKKRRAEDEAMQAGSIVTWRRHECGVNHRSWRTLADCMVDSRHAGGDGPFVLRSTCNDQYLLLPNAVEAVASLKAVAVEGCGNDCKGPGRHRIIKLEPDQGGPT